jgi:hypothetical protein
MVPDTWPSGLGTTHGALQLYAANPAGRPGNAFSDASSLLAPALLGAGGAFFPYSGAAGLGLAGVGSAIDYATTGQPFGLGFYGLGLAGNLLGGGYQGIVQAGGLGGGRAAVYAGFRSILPETLGGFGGAAYGYLEGGTLENALFRAQEGVAIAAIAKGAYNLYRAFAPANAPRTAGYRTLTRELEGTGQQANHLNQNAAFRDVIPEAEGLANGMRGNAFTEVGSPHYEFHRSLEGFWNQFRRGGARFGQTPTNAEYGTALEQALRAGGLSNADAATVAAQAAQQRAAYGLAGTDPVPRIPGRITQTPPPSP